MSNEALHENIFRNDHVFRKYLTPPVLLGLILILGIALRFYNLGTESFWLDEVATTIEAKQSIPQLLTIGRLDQPPAYFLPMHFWLQIFGPSEVSLRSFSALFGVGSIVLIYLVGYRLFGKEVGLLSAFLMAIAEYQIAFSQEARNYSFFEFTTLLSFLFFIHFLQRKRLIYLALYGFASILMVNSNAYGVFILAGQNLFLLVQAMRYRKEIIPWLICQTLILIAIVPYLSPLILGDNSVQGAIDLNLTGIPSPSFSDILRSLYRFILPPRRYFGGDMEWGQSLLAIYALAGVILVLGMGIYVLRKGLRRWLSAVRGVVDSISTIPDVKSKLLLVSCWLLCPMLLPFIASLVFSPVYSHRYVISAAPAFYLSLALGIFYTRKVIPLVISLGVMMILIVPGLARYYAADVKEQWREVASYVEENTGGDEVIVFAPNDNIGIQQEAFNFYYQGNLPGCSIGSDELTDTEVWKILEQCIVGHDRFWVIIRHSTFSPESRYKSFFLNPNQTIFYLVKEQQFYDISTYLFELMKE